MSLADNAFVSAQYEAYAFMRERILNGEFRPGTPIRPDAIAERLSISRMPVREALLQLEADGLVTLRPNRGAVVSQLTAQEAEELIEVRAMLEGLALRHAMPKLNRPMLADLEELHSRMERVRGNPQIWVDRHLEFHRFIATLSGKKHISTLLYRIQNQLLPSTYALILEHGNEELAGAEHGLLMDAIRSQDSDLAERTIQLHIQAFSATLFEFLDGA